MGHLPRVGSSFQQFDASEPCFFSTIRVHRYEVCQCFAPPTAQRGKEKKEARHEISESKTRLTFARLSGLQLGTPTADTDSHGRLLWITMETRRDACSSMRNRAKGVFDRYAACTA